MKPILVLSALLVLAETASAQTKPKDPPARPVGDHGMVLATAMDVAIGKLKDTTKMSDTKNYVFRGKIITLNKERTIHMCFDTELMRVAGIWKGPYIAFAADKNMGPAIEGTMLVATDRRPGWARGEEWNDPRIGREGSLPANWVRYRGLYPHGDKVVLSYIVGDTEVFECPTAEEKNGYLYLRRNFKIGPSRTPLRVDLVQAESSPIAIIGSPIWWGEKRLERGKSDPSTSHVLPPMPKGGYFLFENVVNLAKPGWFEGGTIGDVKFQFDCSSLTKGGPARWKDEIITKGVLGKDDGKSPYVQDVIELPEKNPWNASVRFGGLDFFPDGRAALCTWDGDVWIVSGLDDKLDKVRWKRFAAGLQHPLGLKIVDGFIYVAGRDQITKLHDLNGDGEADFYENINNEPGLTLQRHEFVMGLETDAEGNFYYCRSGHYIQSATQANCCVYKVSRDGKKIEKFATGFREPNGMSIGPDGTITVGDNEGNGIPQTPIYRLKPGAFYGFTPTPPGGGKEGGSWTQTQKPMVWLPKKVDGSAASQVWAPKDRWGPLSGGLVHLSYGNCSLMSVLIDKTSEPWQAAVWTFPMQFQSGLMRGRFNPADGQLYVCGLRGWGTTGLKDGVFSRIRYTGKDHPTPVGFAVVKGGIEVTFSHPLDRKSGEDDQNWAGNWTATFQGKRDDLPIDSVKLSADGKTATVLLEAVRPAVNFTLQYRVKSAAGAAVNGELNGTIHQPR